jgi:peptidoglycan/LPS O-acetylase OafA/YrhL
MNQEYARQRQISGMDGMRALGVLMVLISHLWPRPDSILDYFHFGRVGVILFFVISGFLVTRSLLELQRHVGDGSLGRYSAFATFYYRRALRIFPLYYLALAYLYWVAKDPYVTANPSWLLFYVSNYSFFADVSFGNADHFWTLAVEEQFYFIIPFFLILLAPRRSFLWIVMFFIGGIILKTLFAYSFSARGGFYVWNYATHPLWGCVEGLCLGALLAYKRSTVTWVGSGSAVLAGFLCLTAASVYFYFFRAGINQDVLYTSLAHLCFALFSVTLIAYVSQNQRGGLVRLLELSVFKWIGRISYGVYVIHYIARPGGIEWVARNKEYFPEVLQPYLVFIVVSLFSLGLASLSFVCLEKPLLSLKKLYPKRPDGRARLEVADSKRN